jgi:hypothetical protein
MPTDQEILIFKLVERKKLYSLLATKAGMVTEVKEGPIRNISDLALQHYHDIERLFWEHEREERG